MRKLRILVVSFGILLAFFPLVSADKIDVLPTKDTFLAGEIVSFKISLLDSNNNPINANVAVIIQDAEQNILIEKTVQSNTIVEVNLGEKAPAGYWKITAKYAQIISSALFVVEVNELARFELMNNVLTVINIGNTRYTKTIQIAIGDTIGSKEIDLGVGEKTSFTLIAPEGVYNIKVTDGKTTLSQSDVALTGKVIGILDNRELSKNPLTAELKGEESPYGEQKTKAPNYALVYTFLLVIFGAAILLAIERRFRNRAMSKNPQKEYN